MATDNQLFNGAKVVVNKSFSDPNAVGLEGEIKYSFQGGADMEYLVELPASTLYSHFYCFELDLLPST